MTDLNPPTPGQWRPGQADRQPYADRLKVAVDEGRLNLIEYDQRLRAVDEAKSFDDLAQVVADLPSPPEEILTQIGEMVVTASTVHTPAGPIPLSGAQWMIADQWRSEQKIPSWAIALAVLAFFCVGPFSLLFLLAKEQLFGGHVQVSVSSAGQQYVAYIPVQSYPQVQYMHQQVAYVRSLSTR
jgi:hypothetical protein